MSIHILVGVTIGNQKIIRKLKDKNVKDIIVIDEFHEGDPYIEHGIPHYSPLQAQVLTRSYRSITFHFYRSLYPKMNLDLYEFD